MCHFMVLVFLWIQYKKSYLYISDNSPFMNAWAGLADLDYCNRTRQKAAAKCVPVLLMPSRT